MASVAKINSKYFNNLELLGMRGVLEWCMNEGLIADKYECPVCKKDMHLVERKDRPDVYEWLCRKKGTNPHYIKRSVRKGTWFEDSKLSIIDILKFTYLWVYEASTNLILQELEIKSEATVIDWRNFCREVCIDACFNADLKIGGPGMTVEINECVFGKRKYTEGSRVNGKWVYGGVERGSNKCFFEVVENCTKDALLNVIKRNILPGSTIMSDCWNAYGSRSDRDFVHLSISQSVTFKDPETGAHNKTIEGMWSLIKKEFKRQGHRQTNDLFDSYFAEFMWRRRYRNDPQALFRAFLACVKTIYTPRIADGPNGSA